MHQNYRLTYGALSSLINSKINFWKYKKYCALNISECQEAYSKLFSLPRKNVTVPVSASWKTSHSDIQGRPCFRQQSTAAWRFQIAHILWVAGKEGKKHPCKTHPIRRKNVFMKKKIKKWPFASISLVNFPVYRKCSLRSIIAQITFKQMSEGPLFVWLKLSENTTHFKTSFLQYRLIKNKPSTLCFPILILMNISLWVSSGISLRSDLHGVAADTWYMQSCKTQTHNMSPKGLDFLEITKQGTAGNVLFRRIFEVTVSLSEVL